MRIAVLSGKGGTGKTLVSVNLAAAAKTSTYIDCDVEEPNGHLFFKPTDVQEEEISVKIPQVDNKLCNGCRKCVALCKFNALAYIKDKLIIFDEVCHSCGCCIMFCPEKALTEKEKIIGKVQKGTSDQVKVYSGILNTGEASGIPIIKKLLHENKSETDKQTFITELTRPKTPVPQGTFSCPSRAIHLASIGGGFKRAAKSSMDSANIQRGLNPPLNEVSFNDCPPGSACIVMESIKDADYCILVAEPTLFGVHNLNMVYELVKLFNKPFGVVLNKCLEGENPAEKFCFERNIKILGRIPFDNELGMLNSNAEIAVRKSEKYQDIFSSLLETVTKEVQHETTTNP